MSYGAAAAKYPAPLNTLVSKADTALLERCREALKRSNSTDNTLFERLDERLGVK